MIVVDSDHPPLNHSLMGMTSFHFWSSRVKRCEVFRRAGCSEKARRARRLSSCHRTLPNRAQPRNSLDTTVVSRLRREVCVFRRGEALRRSAWNGTIRAPACRHCLIGDGGQRSEEISRLTLHSSRTRSTVQHHALPHPRQRNKVSSAWRGAMSKCSIEINPVLHAFTRWESVCQGGLVLVRLQSPAIFIFCDAAGWCE